MLWVMTTADKYEMPLCVEKTARELAKKMGISESAVRTTEMRGRKYGQPGDRRQKESYRIYKVKE